MCSRVASTQSYSSAGSGAAPRAASAAVTRPSSEASGSAAAVGPAGTCSASSRRKTPSQSGVAASAAATGPERLRGGSGAPRPRSAPPRGGRPGPRAVVGAGGAVPGSGRDRRPRPYDDDGGGGGAPPLVAVALAGTAASSATGRVTGGAGGRGRTAAPAGIGVAVRCGRRGAGGASAGASAPGVAWAGASIASAFMDGNGTPPLRRAGGSPWRPSHAAAVPSRRARAHGRAVTRAKSSPVYQCRGRHAAVRAPLQPKLTSVRQRPESRLLDRAVLMACTLPSPRGAACPRGVASAPPSRAWPAPPSPAPSSPLSCAALSRSQASSL